MPPTPCPPRPTESCTRSRGAVVSHRAPLTTRARQALHRSQWIARSKGGAELTAGQHLLALFDVDAAFAVDVLAEWGVTKPAVAQELRELERRQAHEPCAALPTLSAHELREHAEAVAAALGHHEVGTEHLLLALYERNGQACQVLTRLGADRHAVRARIVAILNPD